MYEVEVKVRADHDGLAEALADVGAEPLGAVVQKDTYYDAPHRDFAETDEALRIRRECDGEPSESDPVARLTYKGPLIEAGSKTREERETAVADGEAAAAVFEGLGFRPAATVRKERERYAVDEYVVTLDDVDGLGQFVEVETESRDDDVAAARDGALAVLDSLGLDPDAGIRTSYLGLLLESAEETPEGDAEE